MGHYKKLGGPSPTLTRRPGLRPTIDESADLVIVTNSEGVILEVASRSASVACPGAEALVGSSFFHHIHENDLLGVFRVVVDLVVGDVPTAALHLHLQLEKHHWQEFEGSAATMVLPETEHPLRPDHLATTQILYQLHLVTGGHPHPEATLWNTSAFARRWAEYIGGISR